MGFWYIIEGTERRDYATLYDVLQDLISEDFYERMLNSNMPPVRIKGYEFPKGTSLKVLNENAFDTAYDEYIDGLATEYTERIKEFGNRSQSCIGLVYSIRIQEINNQIVYYASDADCMEDAIQKADYKDEQNRERQTLCDWIDFFAAGKDKGAKLSKIDCIQMQEYLIQLLSYKDKD